MSALFVGDTEIAAARLLHSVPSGGTSRSECYGCAWSRDGHYLAWSYGRCSVKLLRWDRLQSDPCDPPSFHNAITIDVGGPVHSITFYSRQLNCAKCSGVCSSRHHVTASPARRPTCDADVTLVTGLKNGRIRTWDARTGMLKLELCDHTDAVTGLSFAPRGHPLLVSSSFDGTLKLWDMDDDGNMIKTFKTNCSVLFDCCWSPDGVTLASVGNYYSVHLWDMKARKQRCRLTGHRNNVTKCEFSPDGILLATASHDSRVIIWNVQLAVAIRFLEHCSPPLSAIYAGGANNAYVRSVSFSGDGCHVATVCDDGFVRFWDVLEEEVPVQAASVDAAIGCRFSPDGSLLAVSTRSGDASIFYSPMHVASLQHLCRITILRMMSSADVNSLQCMPTPLKQYLQYCDQYAVQPVGVCG